MQCKCKNYQDESLPEQEIDCFEWVDAFKSLPIGTVCMIPIHNIDQPISCEVSIELFHGTTSQVIEKIDEVSVMFSDYSSLPKRNLCIKRRLSFDHIDAGTVGFVIFHSWCDRIITNLEDAKNGGYDDREFEVVRLIDDM